MPATRKDLGDEQAADQLRQSGYPGEERREGKPEPRHGLNESGGRGHLREPVAEGHHEADADPQDGEADIGGHGSRLIAACQHGVHGVSGGTRPVSLSVETRRCIRGAECNAGPPRCVSDHAHVGSGGHGAVPSDAIVARPRRRQDSAALRPVRGTT